MLDRCVFMHVSDSNVAVVVNFCISFVIFARKYVTRA